MKKLLVILSLVTTSAFAQHGHHHYHGGSNWIAPLVIGGAIGYALRPQQPVYINSQPVYNVPQPAYGRTPIYEQRSQYDFNCQCYVIVYNQIGWQ